MDEDLKYIVHWAKSFGHKNREKYKLVSGFPSVYGGNVQKGNILVFQLKPDRAEMFWAKRNLSSSGYVMHNETGNFLVTNLKLANFDINKFMFANIVPYETIGGILPEQELIDLCGHITDHLVAHLEPSMIWALGRHTYNALTHSSYGTDAYFDLLDSHKISRWPELNIPIIPLEHPIDADNDMRRGKENAFTTILKQLYVKTQ